MAGSSEGIGGNNLFIWRHLSYDIVKDTSRHATRDFATRRRCGGAPHH